MEKLKLSECLETLGGITTEGGLSVKDAFKEEYAALKQAVLRIKEIDSMKSDEWKKASDAIDDIYFNAEFGEVVVSKDPHVATYARSSKTKKTIRHQCDIIEDYILHSSGFDIKCGQYEEIINILKYCNVDLRAFKIGYYNSYDDYKAKMNLAHTDYGKIDWKNKYELERLGLLTQKEFKVVNEWFAQEPEGVVWRRVWQ